jgi:hypothetical protein
MPRLESVGSLELDQDLPFERKTWLIQRIGWIVMLVAVVAGLLGLFGRGWLSQATAGGPGNPLRIEYERFTRHSSPTQLTLRLAAGAAPDGKARIRFSKPFLDGIKVEDVHPHPDSVEAAEAHVVYVFRVAHPDKPSTITFQIEPEDYWSRQGDAGIEGKEPVRFSQFVFP